MGMGESQTIPQMYDFRNKNITGALQPSSARSSPLTTGQSQQTTSSSSPSFPSSTATPTPAAAAAPAATRPSLPAEAYVFKIIFFGVRFNFETSHL